jgi:hypothetical protein
LPATSARLPHPSRIQQQWRFGAVMAKFYRFTLSESAQPLLSSPWPSQLKSYAR